MEFLSYRGTGEVSPGSAISVLSVTVLVAIVQQFPAHEGLRIADDCILLEHHGRERSFPPHQWENKVQESKQFPREAFSPCLPKQF